MEDGKKRGMLDSCSDEPLRPKTQQLKSCLPSTSQTQSDVSSQDGACFASRGVKSSQPASKFAMTLREIKSHIAQPDHPVGILISSFRVLFTRANKYLLIDRSIRYCEEVEPVDVFPLEEVNIMQSLAFTE